MIRGTQKHMSDRSKVPSTSEPSIPRTVVACTALPSYRGLICTMQTPIAFLQFTLPYAQMIYIITHTHLPTSPHLFLGECECLNATLETVKI